MQKIYLLVILQIALGAMLAINTQAKKIHQHLIKEEALQSESLPEVLDPNPSLSTAMGQLTRAQAFSNKASYPRSTNPDGTIKRVGPSDWTSGFFPGSLWLMYENTKDTVWKARAEQWTSALESQKTNTSTHDVGFILYSSYGTGFRLTGNENYKAILLQGAKSLSTRFNSIVGAIKSWDNKAPYTFPVIIDNMMNLEILFWATKISGDSSYYKIAVKHALTTIANHFRTDNSSYHVVDYNPLNGSILSKGTYQGLNNLSDWARGQAWGLYGFTMCYRETGDVRFLNMAKKIADFYLSHPNTPSDLVPYWDFDAFDYRDASAASIASSGLLELSRFTSDKSTEYYNFGIKILKSLCSVTYSASLGTNNNFILKHSVGNKPKNSEINTPLCYADYYFIQGLLRHKKIAPLLVATGGNKKVILKWNASTGGMLYNLKRSAISGGTFTAIASNIIGTSYTDVGLQHGSNYYYKITCSNISGEGLPSAEAAATTNKLPTVQLIKPVNNQTYITGDVIHLLAEAKDLDGKISKVQFYNGTTLLRTELVYPYTYDWINVPAGTYTLTAKATDDRGLQATSTPVKIVVSLPLNMQIISSRKSGGTDREIGS